MSGLAGGLGAAAALPLQAPSAPQPPAQAFGAPGAIGPEQLQQLAQAQPQEMPDGSLALMVPDENPTDIGAAPDQHADNVAEEMDENDLAQLAEKVLEGIEVDEETMREYRAILREGQQHLGFKVERMDKPFPGASGARHPMLMMALVRWVATARAELLPPAGPVRARVWGDDTDDAEARAQRKADFLNYYSTVVDEGYYTDCDRGHLFLGLDGEIYRKVFRDPLTAQPRSRFVSTMQLTVSDDAESLDTAARVTLNDTVSRDEMARRMWSGYYRSVELGVPGEDAPNENVRAAKQAEGTRPSSNPEYASYPIVEVQAFLDVPGYEHRGDDGEPDGLPIPWLITIECHTRTVLRLERDWREGDELYRRRATYTHFVFMPGLGFHGWGLIHLMANTTDTASVLWRQAINAVSLFTFPGGLRKAGARPESSRLVAGPGEFVEIQCGAGSIQDNVMPFPYRDVPASWVPLLETVVNMGQALGNTTELQVGDANPNAPVGSTLALIEQAMRPEAATLQRAHAAQAREFRMLSALFAEQPEERYPYVVNDKRGVVLGADFRQANDVVPVSDPNVPTQVQRLARAQAKLQLAMANNGLMDVKAALTDMLRTLGCSPGEIKKLMPTQDEIQPSDPITEFARALTGQPLRAFPNQSHQAHLMAHISQMQTPNLPPPIMQRLLAHAGEHLALLYASEFSAMTGVALQPGQPLPPEIEVQVSAAVAAVSDAIIAKISPLLGGAGVDPAKMAEINYKHRELSFKIEESQRKAETAARQDSMEALRDQMQAGEAAKDRHAQMVKMIGDVLLEAARQHADQNKIAATLHKAGLDAEASQREVLLAEHATEQARHGTLQAEHGLRAAIEGTKQAQHKVKAARHAASRPAAGAKPKAKPKGKAK